MSPPLRTLLASGGFRTDARRALLRMAMRAFLGDEIRRLLFVPYALADHETYTQKVRDLRLDAGYQLEGIHEHGDPLTAVREAEAIFVGGGNTFRLAKELQERGLMEPIRTRALEGMPYVGASAGSNVACPTIQTTNDMPIVMPTSLAGLNLVPFQINPHYYLGNSYLRVGDAFEEHFGETRDVRIAEFHEENSATVVGLWEAGILTRVGRRIELTGAQARVFVRGEQPYDVEPPNSLDELLRV